MIHAYADFSREAGTIRKVNGANLAPPVSNFTAHGNLNDAYRAMKLPYARLHDSPLDNPGMRLVDIQQIFCNAGADADDPSSYYFRQTDDYIANCRRCGTDIIYRLGTSIEHSNERYYSYPPDDYEKWADICIHIIRHYNEGWNNGFNWNIRYWEIWNEPDLHDNMWNADLEEFIRFYGIVAARIKRRFPKLMIGGPAFCGLNEHQLRLRAAECRRTGAPLDFFSWHSYTADIGWMLEQPRIARRVLDECGFPGTELHLNEWHYFNADWRQYRNDRLYCREANRAMDGLHGIDSAAFLTSVMTGWQDGPITMGCYYTAGLCWGVFDKYAVPYKTYYALKAFGDLTDFPQRRWTGSDRENVRLLAGCDPGGNAALLVSSFKNAEPIELGISGADLSAMRLLRLDCELDLEPVEPEFRDGKLILTPTASSNVWFLPGIAAGK